MEFTNKSAFPLDHGLSAAFAIENAEQVYKTPNALRTVLGDLARLTYLEGTYRYRLKTDASAGVATVALVAGTDGVLFSESHNLDGSGEYYGSGLVALANVFGGSPLATRVTMDTAAGAGDTAQVSGVLEVSHPLVIVQGCG